MLDYNKQAKDFLVESNAKMSIRFVGSECNQNWNDNIMRDRYNITITTTKGKMSFSFWNSIVNKGKAPSEYDILACLTKYDPGTMYDFFNEMGYKINSSNDNKRFSKIYKAVVKEYNSLCRIFTEEQMDSLREIQ